MKIAIVGSRDSKNITQEFIIENLPKSFSEIVSGGATGIDTLAQSVAAKLGVKFTCFKPNYSLYGKTAPIVRNTQIIEYADYILAFWNGFSKGTKFVIAQCLNKNKPLKIIYI